MASTGGLAGRFGDLELWLPNDGFDYFSTPRAGRPSAASSFDLVDACWLAEASMLVYSSPEVARPKLADALGVTIADVEFVDAGTAQCYTAAAGPVLLVVVRGTELPGKQFVRDMVTNLHVAPVPFAGGETHGGFASQANALFPGIVDFAGRHGMNGHEYMLAGHSLGGAVAVLLAALVGPVRAVYTYGCPAVGDGTFAGLFPHGDRTFRFVHNNDIVAKLPGVGSYRHIGSLVYIDSRGRLHFDISPMKRLEDSLLGILLRTLEAADALRRWKFLIPDDRLTDHAPVNYVNRLRNSL